MVWWLTYFSVFSDLYIGSSLALDAMLAEGAYDRCAHWCRTQVQGKR